MSFTIINFKERRGVDGKPIRSFRELSDHNKRHGVVDVGDDKHEEFFKKKKKERESLNITGKDIYDTINRLK